jgi:signal transduction histidine kinase
VFGRMLDQIEAWNNRLYRLNPVRLKREERLRSEMLRRILLATCVATLLFFMAGLLGLVTTENLYWISAELFALIPACRWLSRRGKVSTGTTLFVAVLSHPAAFLLGEYGVRSPAGGLFLPSILVCGLLIGGYFLWTWTAVCCLMIGLVPAASVSWERNAIATMIPAMIFWWVMTIIISWLVRLFSEYLEQMVQVARGQSHALSRTLSLMIHEQPLEGMLGHALGVFAEEIVGGDVQLWTLDPDGHLRFTSSSASDDGSTATPCPIAAEAFPIWQLLRETRRTVLVATPGADPRMVGRPDLFRLHDRELLFAPILSGPDVAGFVLIRQRLAEADPGELELAETLALQLSLCLELLRLARAERLSVVVEERNRMAREIHDTLAQGFTGVVVQLNAAEQAISRDPDAIGTHIAAARQLARVSLDEARRSVWALRPLAFESVGLSIALDTIARQLSADGRIRAEVTTNGQVYSLPAEVERELVRVGQEAMTNVVRHACANHLVVRISYGQESLRLEIEDDGIGGATGECPQTGSAGFGLVGMRERVARLGGRLRIDSPPASGTRVVVDLPRGQHQ